MAIDARRATRAALLRWGEEGENEEEDKEAVAAATLTLARLRRDEEEEEEAEEEVEDVDDDRAGLRGLDTVGAIAASGRPAGGLNARVPLFIAFSALSASSAAAWSMASLLAACCFASFLSAACFLSTACCI
jgi:hypothetical protein